MLTPRFALAQDDTFLTVTIYAPFTNIDQVLPECPFLEQGFILVMVGMVAIASTSL